VRFERDNLGQGNTLTSEAFQATKKKGAQNLETSCWTPKRSESVGQLKVEVGKRKSIPARMGFGKFNETEQGGDTREAVRIVQGWEVALKFSALCGMI